MAKNDKLINSLTKIARRNRQQNMISASEEFIPQVYAALAIALHRKYGFGAQRISAVFAESQAIWGEFSEHGDEMIQLCEDETGVRVVNPHTERSVG
ncbi:MAG: hypothetical protein LUC83_09960 [Clostridiales bacterium]|nr:hypothetical protein [Clostridiales bacterium]